jgi:hypothetical protein
MRRIVVLILLLAPTIWGQAPIDSQNGVIEFYTTQSANPRTGALVIYVNEQRVGEVAPHQTVRFSGSPATYRFSLKPNAPVAEHVAISLLAGQHLYLRVSSEGFYLGNEAEAVRPLSVSAAADSTNRTAASRNTPALSPPAVAATTSSNDQGQNATIVFYREREGPNQQVTVYSLYAAGNQPIATLQKGEYFAISVSPGMSAYSWVPAPARGQTTILDLLPGQEIFLRVQPSGLNPVDNDAARTNLVDLQAVHRARIFDLARIVEEPAIPFLKSVRESADDTGREVQPNSANKAATSLIDSQQESTQTREINIRGYVTAVTSPTTFEIEDYRITHGDAIDVQYENRNPQVQFNIDRVKVGTELDVKGDFDENTRQVRAKTIKVDLGQFRKFRNTAVLMGPPTGLVRNGNGWTGTLFADERIQVSPDTKVSFKEAEEIDNDNLRLPSLTSLQGINAGMLITYEGVRDLESGMILADSVEFSRNEFDKGEQDLWFRSMVRFKAGDPSNLKPDELTVPGVGKYKVVPSEEVQAYVTKVGRSLVPRYALTSAATDPSRFRFQFYVVIDDEPNAYALPTGVFVIHSGLFALLENEAQLAAVIGHELAHALQEHQWREIKDRKILTTPSGVTVAETFGRRTLRDLESLTEMVIRNGYTPSQENQADRASLEYMVAAGYDPREAPQLWDAIAKANGYKGKTFYDTYDNHPARRSYLANQLKNTYSDLNFANLRIEETSFKRMTHLANDAVSGKTKADPLLQSDQR